MSTHTAVAAPPECSEHQAKLFSLWMQKQFKDDPVPIRCRDCGPLICWEDQMVAKHWLTWCAALASQ